LPLHFGSLYWPGTYPDPARYPALRGRAEARAVIVGGGMSGVACGYAFSRSGIDAVLLERNRIAAGSTAVNTGLLQFANDTMLSELSERIGERQAVRFYRACAEASEKLCDIAEGLRGKVDFNRRGSLYYASVPQDVPALRKEYEALERNGFSAEWWDENRIAASFPFRKAAAIVTRGDSEVNPYRFVHAMAEEAVDNGLKIYENSPLLDIEEKPNGYVVKTNEGSIEAEHIVYAVGYTPEAAGGRWINAIMNRTYALVTAPLPSLPDWPDRLLIWETARPYLYFRTTPDNRIIAGGLDETARQPVLDERALRVRSMRLMSELRLLFPDLSPEIRYEWCATFGGSPDGLPWIGEDPDRPGQHYCLGYGGNGTIYSLLGAEIIRDRILGDEHPAASIVRPDRRNPRHAAP